jgi:hypothetical protein
MMSCMKALCCAVVLAAACAHGSSSGRYPLANWRAANPGAAQQLCAFNHQYPSLAMDVRKWVLDHPAQAQMLLEWAADNPGSQAPLNFFPSRVGLSRPDVAVLALWDWATLYPDAAQDLSGNPAGLRVAFGAGGC